MCNLQLPHLTSDFLNVPMIIMVAMVMVVMVVMVVNSGLHKLWYPSIRDTSTWSKFGAHGEHGDVFLFSNLGAL